MTVSPSVRRVRLAEDHLDAGPLHLSQHEGERGGRRHMRLLGKVERRREAVREVGLQRAELGTIEKAVALRAPRKALQLAAVARGGDDDAAVRLQRRVEVAPQGDALAAELAQHGGRGLRLALGRQHDAAVETRRIRERLGAGFDQPHAMARAGKRERLPESEDSGAEHRDGARIRGHASSVGLGGRLTVRMLRTRRSIPRPQSPSAAPSRRASAAPSRRPSRRVTMWTPEFISDGTMR